MARNGDFETWLCGQLKSLDLDDEVYLPYVVSILEEEEDKAANNDGGASACHCAAHAAVT